MEHRQPPPDLQIEFFGRPKLLSIIRSAVDEMCRSLGMPAEESSRICLAVDEAVCNVIRHGYDEDPDKRIELWITAPRKPRHAMLIEILDRAREVDPKTIRSRDLDDVRPGGLGVHIISEIMDEVAYQPREGGGMHLRMQYVMKSSVPSGSSPQDG